MSGTMHAGLCAACAHRRVVTSGRGSSFLLCEFSRVDPGFPRYPRLPVLACPAYEPEGNVGGAEPFEPESRE